MCPRYKDKSSLLLFDRCQSSLKGLRIELLNQFFLYCKLYMRIGSSLLKELYLCIKVLISPLSIMLSISLLQEFTFGQLIHQLPICPHFETLQQPHSGVLKLHKNWVFSFLLQLGQVQSERKPLALQMCFSAVQSQSFFNFCLPGHSFLAGDFGDFLDFLVLIVSLPPTFPKAFKMAALKRQLKSPPNTLWYSIRRITMYCLKKEKRKGGRKGGKNEGRKEMRMFLKY